MRTGQTSLIQFDPPISLCTIFQPSVKTTLPSRQAVSSTVCLLVSAPTMDPKVPLIPLNFTQPSCPDVAVVNAVLLRTSWISCVPSGRSPTLVCDVGNRVLLIRIEGLSVFLELGGYVKSNSILVPIERVLSYIERRSSSKLPVKFREMVVRPEA
jgi:hypothetical protein